MKLSLLLLFSTALSAQNFNISTFAGPNAIGTPVSLAADSAGNFYCATYNHRLYKIDSHLAVTIVAGNGSTGIPVDGTPAISAPFNGPDVPAVDPSGNLYIADSSTTMLWKISPDGILHKLPTTGLRSINGLAADASGAVYIADYTQNEIFKLPAGATAPAALASVPGASSLAVDSLGNVFVGQFGVNRISRVSPTGAVTVVAGTGTQGHSGDGGPATQANIYPSFVAVGNLGDLYFTESPIYDDVRHIDSTGIITTVAGQPSVPGSSYGDGFPAAQAAMQFPKGIAVGPTGIVYIADISSNRVREIDAAGIMHTVFGSAGFGYWGDSTQATLAGLYAPNALAIDSAGSLYISDSLNKRVRKVDSAGIITTFVLTTATPNGLAFDPSGNLYIQTQSGVSKVTPGGQLSAFSNNLGPIAFDPSGNFYFAANNAVYMTASDGSNRLIAGTGTAGYSGDGGAATLATFRTINSLAFDPSGNLFVSDSGNYAVRKVDTKGIVQTVAGTGSYPGDPTQTAIDTTYYWGPATSAPIRPLAVACDRQGNVYIADFLRTVFEVVPGGYIVRVAGDFQSAYYGDGGPSIESALVTAVAVVSDANGNVYIADSNSNAIRMLHPVGAPTIMGKIYNAGSYVGGAALAPGEIFLIAGSNLGPEQLVSAQLTPAGSYPTSVAGTTVTIDGQPIPLLYSYQNQVAAIVPYQTSTATHTLALAYENQPPASMQVTVQAYVPGLFVQSSFSPELAALNQDGTVNSPASPAHAGTVVTIYATGLGQTNPSSTTGGISPGAGYSPLAPLAITMNGVPAQILYQGAAPGLTSSLTQINVMIPAGLSGTVTVSATELSGSAPAIGQLTVIP